MEPQWAKDKKARALALRKERKSYEQIAAELAITPWQAFAWTNPTKLPKQIAAWMQKHYPEGSEERERAIAQVHAGRRRERGLPEETKAPPLSISMSAQFMRSVLVRHEGEFRWFTGDDINVSEDGLRLTGKSGTVNVPWAAVVGLSAIPISAPVGSTKAESTAPVAPVVNVYAGERNVKRVVTFSDGKQATVEEVEEEDEPATELEGHKQPIGFAPRQESA